MYYVYRFKDLDDQIVYVGKTNNIKNRMQTHFSGRGHLTKEQYDNVTTVEYVELPTKIDMDIKELYYINKWKPSFNTINVAHETALLEIIGRDTWKVYRSKKEDEIKKLHDDLLLVKSEVDKKDKIIQELSELNNNLNNHNKYLQEKYKNFDQELQKERDLCRENIASFVKLSDIKENLPNNLVYVKVQDAILLAKHFKNFSFISKIRGRKSHIFEIINKNGIPYLKESVGNSIIEEPLTHHLQSAFSQHVLAKFDNIIVTSGQTKEKVDEAIIEAREIERMAQEKTKSVRNFVEKGSYYIKRELGYEFEPFIGQRYSEFGEADYSRVYDLIKEKQINTPKRLLEILCKFNGHEYIDVSD